jgi:hypothetical protein
MSVLTALGILAAKLNAAAAAAGASAVAKCAGGLAKALESASAIEKNRIESKLAKKTLEQMESLIVKASLDDVNRYDSKTQMLVRNVRTGVATKRSRPPRPAKKKASRRTAVATSKRRITKVRKSVRKSRG